jgi:hypothetical protein
MNHVRNADATGLGNTFKPRGDIDAISKDIRSTRASAIGASDPREFE